MSTNTIKLSSTTGDKYIGPQQTLIYKDYELFGYGYLDWGRVVNQAFVNLIDQLDLLKDSGLSEIQFDLEGYTEEQTRLRTQEFLTWKTGFVGIIDEKIQTYINSTKEAIELVKTTQDEINEAINVAIEENYTELSDGLSSITDTLDEKIIEVINTQITTLLEKVETLTQKVSKSQADLSQATSSLNEATSELKQLMDSFKEEFNTAFAKFKEDTNNALLQNKEFLINYIDTKISGTNTVTSNLEDRLLTLEILSDSLNPVLITQLITGKVNEITEGIIDDYLDNYNDRLLVIESAVSQIDNKIEEKITEEINAIEQIMTNKFQAYDQTLLIMNGKVNNVEESIVPIDQMRIDIVREYGEVGKMLIHLFETYRRGMDSQSIIAGIGVDYKSIIKNTLESLLDQNAKNASNIMEIIDSKILNLCNGLSSTSFNELALITDTTKTDKLKSEFYNFIKGNVSDYSNNDFKFMYLTSDEETGMLDFAFKLPKNINLALWSTAGILITNTRTGENIDSAFYITDTLSNPYTLEFFGSTPITGLVQSANINAFRYSLALNVSETVFLKFEYGFLPTDTIQFKFYKDNSKSASGLITTKSVTINQIENSYKIDANWISTIYPDLYKVDYTIGKDALTLIDTSYTLNNTKVMIPISKISYRQDGTKEFLIKVKLPTGATLTKIEYTDGYSTQTKTFVNHDKFPLSKAEYDSRNLASTENYYKDICSTGVLDYQIHIDSKKVTGTITYKIGTTTKTLSVNTTSGGGGDTVFIEHTILAGQYVEIDSQPHFGSVDAKRSLVDVKVKDTTSTSETYNMYINGDNFSTIAIRDSRYIRIYNEFNSTLSFYIAITDR